MLKQKSKTQKKKAKRTKGSGKEECGHPFGYFDWACSFAAFGETEEAFSLLEKAVKLGFREHKWLTEGQSFKGLRKDKRWPAIIERCRANREAYLESINLELYRMERRFGRDRFRKGLDPDVLEKRNARRRKKVRGMLESGALRVADDFERAAGILCDASDSSDCELARTLALKAVKLDPKNRYAKAVAAMAEDRYLLSIGKPQIYGTQFRIIRGKKILEEPYDLSTIADEERNKLFGTFMYYAIKSARENSEARKRRSRKSSSRRSRKARR
jgi:hypothetical protein